MAVTFNEVMSRSKLRLFQIFTFIICMIVLTADGMDAQLLGLVAPLIRKDYGVDGATFGWAVSLSVAGFGFGSWSGGWLGDRVGRRWSLALAAVVFSLGTMAASTADNVLQMSIWRFISGLGFGSAYANAITLSGEWLPERWRSVAVTTLSVGTPAGQSVVSAMVPTLVALWGWRGAFLAVGALTFVCVILIIVWLRDSPAFLLARGKLAEARQATKRITDEEVELVAERHHSDTSDGAVGVLDRSNLRLNIGVGLSFTACTMVAYGVLSYMTTLLQKKGFTFDQAANVSFWAGLTAIAGSIAAGIFVRKYGSRLAMKTISFSLLVVLLLVASQLEGLSGTPSDSQRLIIGALICVAATIFSSGVASMYAIMTHGYPSSCRSAGIGFGIFMGRIGAIVSSQFGGALLDMGAGSTIPYFSVLCLGAVMISSAAFIVDRQVPPAKLAAAAH